MSKEIVFSVNTAVMGKLAKEKKWTLHAYWAATSKVKPVKGVQVVSMADETSKVIEGADRLCELGILKPFKGSRTKFYVPRTVAFATYEPKIETV